MGLGLGVNGSTVLRDSRGLDIRTSANEVRDALAEHPAKAKQLAVEATHGGQKEGKQHGRTPFQIAADFFQTGDFDDLDLWREYEEVSEGRRQFTWREWKLCLRERTEDRVSSIPI